MTTRRSLGTCQGQGEGDERGEAMIDSIREAAIHYQDGLITLGEFHLKVVQALITDDTITLDTMNHAQLEILARHLASI